MFKNQIKVLKARVIRKAIVWIFSFASLLVNTVFAQETPYYELPKNRKSNHEAINMPNLSSSFIKYYFGLTGGLYKNYSRYKTSNLFGLSNSQPSTLYWETFLGKNTNNNIFLETGLISVPTYLVTDLFGVLDPRIYPRFATGQNQINIPFRVKKRIFTFDKISKSAIFTLGLGVGYRFNQKAFKPDTVKINNLFTPLRPQNGIESFLYFNAYKKSPLNFELIAELRGIVTDRFEMILFFKGLYAAPSQFVNTFDIGYFNGTKNVFKHELTSISFAFGLQSQLNSPKFLKYKSKVD